MAVPENSLILYIDSQQQLTDNNTFTVNIDNDIQSQEYDYCSLIQIQIPVSFYILQSGSNIFTLNENGSTVSVTIPPGNYSVYSFQSTLGPLLSSLSPNGYTYTLNYNNIFNQVDTGLYNYTCSNTGPNISFIFPAGNAISEPFGFVPGSTAIFSNGSLISKTVISFIPETSIYLHANFIQGNSQSKYSDVLAVINSSNSAPYSTINYTNPQVLQTAKKTLPCLGRVLTFSLTDEYGNAIFLNGGNIIAQILFFKNSKPPDLEIERKFYSLVENYIKMKIELLEIEYSKKEREAQLRENFEMTLLSKLNDIVESLSQSNERLKSLLIRNDQTSIGLPKNPVETRQEWEPNTVHQPETISDSTGYIPEGDSEIRQE